MTGGRLKNLQLSGWGFPIGMVVTVWLAWQIALQPISQRLPPATAIRLAPASAEVLSRSAEIAWTQGQAGPAEVLAQEALKRQPFSVRAVRVLGMAKAKRGEADAGVQLITLAGNWSLRDGPSHAWLVHYYLSRGSYGPAFAHADTLLRRRGELQQTIFPLLTTGALQDQRALSPLVRLLRESPPWRRSYVSGLLGTPEGRALASALAMNLRDTKAPFSDVELTELYVNLNNNGEVYNLQRVRDHLSEASAPLLSAGDFSSVRTLGPLGWTLYPAAGISAEITDQDPDGRSNAMLQVIYDGYASGTIADQVTLLAPGRYVLTGRSRIEQTSSEPRLSWVVSCFDGGAVLARVDPPTQEAVAWRRMSGVFMVPAGCPRQRVALIAAPRDRRRTLVYWFDDLRLLPANSTPAASGP